MKCALCERPLYCRGWCRPHYRRWERTGSPVGLRPALATPEHFWSQVSRPSKNACWTWNGYRQPTGYGRLRYQGRSILAHRLAYELTVGPIQLGKQLHHRCANPPCVNPAHLVQVTGSENNAQRDRTKLGSHQRDKTRCIRGHPFDEANTYYRPSGHRMCRECARERDRHRPRRG